MPGETYRCATCGDVEVEVYGFCDGFTFCSDSCMEAYLNRGMEEREAEDLPLEPEDSDLMREW